MPKLTCDDVAAEFPGGWTAEPDAELHLLDDCWAVLIGASRAVWVLGVLAILLGFASAARGQVVCNWTDNPIVVGETPIKAAHINEIRACIDQIIRSIGTTTPEPPAGEGHFVVSNLRQYPPGAGGANWLYFYVTARSAIQDLTLEIRFEQPGGAFGRCTERLVGLIAGQLVEVYKIPGVCGPSAPWVAVLIEAPEGFTCEGCGAYSAADIPTIEQRPARSLGTVEVR